MLIHPARGRHHIDCLDSRAFADESGARCRCTPGYAPPEPCKIGDRSCSCYSCKSEYSEHHHSLDGQKCTACPRGETADEAGVHCVVSLQWHCFGCLLPRQFQVPPYVRSKLGCVVAVFSWPLQLDRSWCDHVHPREVCKFQICYILRFRSVSRLLRTHSRSWVLSGRGSVHHRP